MKFTAPGSENVLLFTKMIITTCLLLTVILLPTKRCIGQGKKGYITVGFQFGGTQTEITELDSTILNEPFFLHYGFNTTRLKNLTGGAFIGYRFPESKFALQMDLEFASKHSKLSFTNYMTNFKYDIEFLYNYFDISPHLKYYFFKAKKNFKVSEAEVYSGGFYARAGANIGIILNPAGLKYSSKNGLAAFGSDAEQEKQLRLVLKGKTHVALTGGIGFELSGWVRPPFIEVRYTFGVSDMVETEPNSYNFIERKNLLKNMFSVTAGFMFKNSSKN